MDLNNDGHNDIIVTDVDVDIPGCTRTTHIYRNLGNTPNVSFSEQDVGIDGLQGVHDIAVFDINGDGVLDMVFGRCDSTEIYIQEGPSGILFGYPGGIPGLLEPGVATTLEVQLNPLEGVVVDPSSVHVLAAIGDDSTGGSPPCVQGWQPLRGGTARGGLSAVAEFQDRGRIPVG